MASPVVFADANVLYSSALRDLLMQLAVDGTITLRWSEAVQDEWTNAVIRQRPDLAERVRRTRLLMAESLPDACVTGHEYLISTLALPDPADRHVLAAASHGSAEFLLTFNLKDFPQDRGAGQPVVVHPDEFLASLGASVPDRMRHAVVEVLARLTAPPIPTEQYCEILSRQGLARTATLIGDLLSA